MLTNGGVAGIWIVAWLRGWIRSPAESESAQKECRQWRAMYLEEREAHERTREAFREAGMRAQAAVDTSQLLAGALAAVRAAHEAPPAPRAQPGRG